MQFKGTNTVHTNNPAFLKISTASLALSIALVSGTGFASAARAQTAPKSASVAPESETIVVVGSAIRQIADKSTLPVTLVSAKDIAKTGLTSSTDLIQNLPAMQGFVPASSSVNGGGGGVTTAAIHSLPSKYTLTLIDGQRVAPMALGSVQGGGFGVNIESIPLAAIESVEVLRDGAGALYDADAVAGVVNFRLKKNYTGGDVYATGTIPQRKGGGSWSAGISKGFGSLDTDGYNVFVSYSHDEQASLAASQRKVSQKGAYFTFENDGKSYVFFNPTSNTEPANISVAGKSFNPYYNQNGNCGNPNAFPLKTDQGQNCRFNYAATVQDIPSSKRDSGLIKATARVGDGELWFSGFISQYNMIAQFAPPAQPMGLNPTTRFPKLWDKYVAPFLKANGLTATRATLNYRAVSGGGRADDFGSTTAHVAVGYDGNIKGFDVHVALVKSHVHATDTAAGGYLDYDKLAALVADGKYDPVTGEGAENLKSAILNSRFSTTDSDVESVNFNVSHSLFALPGGDVKMALGAEYDRTSYKVGYSDLILSQSGFSTQPDSSDYPVGGNYGAVPFGASRNNWAVFSEVNLPVIDGLEINAQGRYDHYYRVYSDWIFQSAPDPKTGLQMRLPSGFVGNSAKATTGKLSFRYQPVKEIAVRGSVGAGFRAPALSDVAGALTFGGSTSGTYACPFPGSAGCQPGSAQYDLVSGPNSLSGANGLKPEKSLNWGLGVSFTPIPAFFLNVDYWNVKLTHQIQSQGIAEDDGFNNPAKYASLFINPYADPAGYDTIAFQQVPFNGGGAKYSGIDWDMGYSTQTRFGRLSADWSGTWTLTQKYSYGDGQPYNTDLGVYGPDQQVVFRVISSLVLSLESGKLTNTITTHFKTGYRDKAYTADNAVVFTNKNGLPGDPVDFPGLSVPAIATFDWQGVYRLTPTLAFTAGIKNLTDRAPPLSLQTGGGGNQVGYDGRYYDPIGRSFYARFNIKF